MLIKSLLLLLLAGGEAGATGRYTLCTVVVPLANLAAPHIATWGKPGEEVLCARSVCRCAVVAGASEVGILAGAMVCVIYLQLSSMVGDIRYYRPNDG